MPTHIRSSVDPDSSSIETLSSGMGFITSPHPPPARSEVLEILQREQDHAVSLLSLSPFLSSLFISYANRVATLDSAPTSPSPSPSPESEEWKALQTAVTILQGNGKRGSGIRGTAGNLGVAEASREALHHQIASLKETNMTQHDNIRSLRAELSEAENKYNRLLEDSNAEKAALQAQVLDLEARQAELKESVVEQQIKISKLERRITEDAPIHQPPPPPKFPRQQRGGGVRILQFTNPKKSS